jgi:hypothetical protein
VSDTRHAVLISRTETTPRSIWSDADSCVIANNLAPFYKRVTGITLGFIATNSGGILST